MLQGKAYWAKVVGAPVKGYAPTDPKEWTFDVALDDATVARLKAEGAAKYIKQPKNNNDHGGQSYLRFKRRERTADGSEGKPYRIVDHAGKPWDGKTLIGNGSTINVKYALNEQTTGPNRGSMKPTAFAIQVVKLVDYEGGESFPSYDDEGNEENWD